MGNNMTKKITFDSAGFPRFSEDGEYETALDTNLVHRFYLDGEELKDKYPGKTDEEIVEIELAAHEQRLADNAAQDAAIAAEREAQQ
jgi:uncharacterized protein with von Willebrand factor type A (vWA) domain